MASEQAAQWADKELYQSQRESLDRARELAFHLSRNMGWTAADMSDVLRRLEQVSKGIASRVMKPAEGSRATESPAGL